MGNWIWGGIVGGLALVILVVMIFLSNPTQDQAPQKIQSPEESVSQSSSKPISNLEGKQSLEEKEIHFWDYNYNFAVSPGDRKKTIFWFDIGKVSEMETILVLEILFENDKPTYLSTSYLSKNDFFYFKIIDGELGYLFKEWDFPLELNKKYEIDYYESGPIIATIEAIEQVDTKAGSFEADKIRKGGLFASTFWYSDEVGNNIKRISDDGKITFELISFGTQKQKDTLMNVYDLFEESLLNDSESLNFQVILVLEKFAQHDLERNSAISLLKKIVENGLKENTMAFETLKRLNEI